MRIDKPTVFTPSPDTPRSLGPARPVDRAAVVPIADALSALVFDEAPAAPRRTGRLGGEIGGAALPRPAISTRLPLRRGGWRHVLLVNQPAERLARAQAHMTIDGARVAEIDPGWLQSPLADHAALIDGLTEPGRNRLTRMLATTGASLFGGGAGFGAALLGLVRASGAPELRLAARVPLGRGAVLLSCRAPAGVAAISGLAAVSADRVWRVAGHASTVEAQADGALLHLVVPSAFAGRTLLITGPAPMTLDASAPVAARPIGRWLARRSPATRAWALRALEGLAPRDAAAAALLHELRHRDAPPPALAVRHLSAAPGGLLFLGDLGDPNGLVRAVRIEGGGIAVDVPVDLRSSAQDRPVGGLVPAERLRGLPTKCRFRLVYGSGHVQPAGDWPVAAFDGATPSGFARLGHGEAAARMAEARLSRWSGGAAPAVETIGVQPAKPTLAVVAPAGVDPDVLRARAALLHAETGAGAVETIYLAGAREAEAVSRLLAEIRDVFGLGCKLLVFPDPTDPAERLRVALATMRSPAALVLGAATLPAAPGWLDAWRGALAGKSGPAIRGGTLLAADGAVIDAGGDVAFDRAGGAARIDRRGVGLPAALLPREATAATEVITAECVGLSRRAVAALARLAGHYPDPDALLLALANRFRRGRGAGVTMLDARFVRFGDGAVRDPLDAAALARAVATLVRTKAGETRA